jgi:hypothetical protein
MAKAPKAPKEETHPPPEEQAKGPGRPRRTVEKPVSLYPLTFEEAVRGLLQVKMEREERPPAKSRRGAPKKRA